VSSPAPLPPSSHAKPVDAFPRAADLERDLRRVVRGEVRFDAGSRALYATDASNYRHVPIGLVIPRDADDVVATVAACRAHGAPILPRGAGTSLAGQSCNVAVVLDFTKHMHGILELDADRRFARVQPGVVLDTLRDRAEQHHLTFGPDPSTHNRCTIGGMIGNNSCGTHSLLAGKTVDNIETLDVLLYDGTRLTVGATSEAELAAIVRGGGRRGQVYAQLAALRDRYGDLVRRQFPDIPRRVSGYNLDQLLPEHGFNVARALVGTEGTCAIVLEATTRLIPSPQHRALVALGFRDTFAAADAVPAILELSPIGLEGFEGSIIDGLRRKGASNLDLMPAGRGFLLVEFGADDRAAANVQAERLLDRVSRMADPPAARAYTAAQARAVWRIRESGPRAAGSGPTMRRRWEGWDDASVAPEKLGAYLRDLRALLDEFQYESAWYGHFGHGCIHMQISFDLESEPGVRTFGAFLDRAADLVVRYGGSLSGEHGDGQARGALLPKMFGPELMTAFREFKAIWDPDDRMNPNKGVGAPSPIEDLRLGADYAPWQPHTHLAFPDDKGAFANAALRCTGLGACRKHDEGTMCPSYMVTLEEAHSTRGRAHMLFEMLQGEVVRGGWANEQVKSSLDLCLSCKACKSECPTNVDLASYRAEFLSHYYEERRRPLAAHAFGFVDRWARLGSAAPMVANLLLRAPGASQAFKKALGVAPGRDLPRLAPESFRRWVRRRKPSENGALAAAGGRPPRPFSGQPVVLWADTFNTYFHPETSRAAFEVLEHAGFSVTVPRAALCCGRPLYDFGFLREARTYLTRVLSALGESIEAGVPIVVLEPSCASVFRDEIRQLLPNDSRAERLARQTVLLSELLERHAPGYEPPRLSRRVLLHGHCHHKAVMKMTDELALLNRMGADLDVPDAGCCGMAGPFGLLEKSVAVSQAIGERVLLPAVRRAAGDTLIVADGFSCREQIRQGAGRPALHLAEVIRLALSNEAAPGRPEGAP
jgi:FAD/FMN-containing dehydrogenase/Fe-S oxidoreductase